MFVYRLTFKEMEKKLKRNIKATAKKYGTTIGEVCNRMNKDRLFIYRITDKVSLQKIIEIARAIGCEPSELLKGL